MSNLNHPGRAALAEGGPVRTLETERLGTLSQALAAASPLQPGGSPLQPGGSPARPAVQEMVFALVSFCAAIGMWAGLVYVLASRLQPPTLF